MRRARTSSLPVIPDTLHELANQFIAGDLNRYSIDEEVIYKGVNLYFTQISINTYPKEIYYFYFLGCVQDTNGKYSIVFASQSLINNALTMCKRELHADATFRIVPSKPKSYQLLTLHGIIENHVSYKLLINILINIY